MARGIIGPGTGPRATSAPSGRLRSAVASWRGVLVQSVLDLRATHALEWAAALAFYALLSLFPLLLAGAALAAYVADAGWAVERVTHLLGQFIPRGEVEVERIVAAAATERRRVGLLSVVVLLATGRRVLGVLTTALNLVSDVDERRDNILRRVSVELALLTGLGGLFALALSAGPLLDLLWSALGELPGPDSALVGVVPVVVRALLLLATFGLVYAVVPRGPRDRRAVLVGATAATLLYLIAHAGFLLSLRWVWDNLSLIYGPLATAAVLLLWAWYVGLITLFGASLASHSKAMLLEGRSPAEAAQRHLGHPPVPSETVG